MSSYTDSTTTSSAEDQCGYNRITAIHPDIIQTHILNKLDGAALASTSCASSQFLSLCGDEQLWLDICNSTWPSTTDPRVLRAISTFPSAHRSFYFDSFPSIHDQLPKKTCLSGTSQLIISAIDIYYKDQVIFSNVSESTSNVGHWISFTRIPLKFEGHDSTFMSHAEQHLKVSWIMIDPKNKRAVNVASHKAVESRLQGCDIRLRYATVAAIGTGNDLVQCAVLVTCRRDEEGRELHVRRVQMHIEDIEGKTLGWRESVGILQAAMQGPRRRIDSSMEKDNYETFLRKKAQHREKQPNWPCVIVVFLIWTAIFFPLLLKYIDLVENDESWLGQLHPDIRILVCVLTPYFYGAVPILILIIAKVL